MKIINLAFLLILCSCAFGVKESGGDGLYIYRPELAHSSEELAKNAHEYVKTSMKDPSVGKMEELFAPGMPAIKRIGIISFEALIQPTYGGVAPENSVFLSASGKQLMVESFLKVWEQSLGVLGKDFSFIKTVKIDNAKTSQQYGTDVTDHIKVNRSHYMPDDIFYLNKGKLTTYTALVNPRKMRDLSLLLVPAYELMGGPKFSDAQKHYVNELCKELKLDGVLVIFNDVEWSVKGVDKYSDNKDIPEEAKIKISASLVLPFSNYHHRLDLMKYKGEKPQQSITYRDYKTSVRIPLTLSVAEEEKNLTTIEKNLLTPVMDVYVQLTQMIISELSDDMKKTY